MNTEEIYQALEDEFGYEECRSNINCIGMSYDDIAEFILEKIIKITDET